MTHETSASVRGNGPPIRLSRPSLASRKMPRRSRVAFCGTLTARGRRIEHESGLEAKVASVLLVRRDLVDLREQLPPLRYVDAAGAERHTRFDFLARLRDGSRIAIAAKPSAVAERTGLEATLRLIARQTPRSFATHVRLMTERDVPDERVYNAGLLLSVRNDPETTDPQVVAAIAGDLEGSIRIDALVIASGLGGRGFRAVVRCIDRGTLRLLDGGRIGPGSLVRTGGPA